MSCSTAMAGWLRAAQDPAAIEEAAASLPLVVTSAAVGRPDPYAGETPMLYVVLRKEDPEIPADLQTHMERSVPEPPTRPKAIVVLSALPLTGPGKFDKEALRRDATARGLRLRRKAETSSLQIWRLEP